MVSVAAFPSFYLALSAAQSHLVLLHFVHHGPVNALLLQSELIVGCYYSFAAEGS